MLMAFLRRIINGGGRLEREYALGRGALDLIIEWRGARHVIEVKQRRDSYTEERAIEQVAAYLDSLGQDEGWLVLFELRTTTPWSERLWTRDIEHAGKRIHLVGC
jgi:Holliday junction resolvase-like predicted endonuclease